MIKKELIRKNASLVLLNTIDSLFDNNKSNIDAFFDDFVNENKRNKKLKKEIKNNEYIDELLLDELEKRFTQNDIGRVLQNEMVKQNDQAIDELTEVLDEKLRPIAGRLKKLFNDENQYQQFKKLTTEALVVNNLDLDNATIKALKTMKISGMQSVKIIDLISQII